MQNSTNMRILELLRFLYERTDENHPATVSDIIAHLNGKGIQAVREWKRNSGSAADCLRGYQCSDRCRN